MAIRDWSTAYTGLNPVQDDDPVGDQSTGAQPDLDDGTGGTGDELRSTQVEAPRDKLQAVAKMVGDSVNNPDGSICDIIDRDHSNGDARQVRLRNRAADPTNQTNVGHVYTKNLSGNAELFYRDSGGNTVQLTSSGIIHSPSVIADSSTPYITRVSDTVVNVAAAPGEPSTVYKALQDGKLRSFSGTKFFNITLGATDGGLDTGTEAGSTWYYLYLVPSTADDNLLEVRGSVSGPSTGPTGYTNFKYLGAIYNNQFNNIDQFGQAGYRFAKWPLSILSYSQSNVAPFSLTSLNLSNVIPETAGMVVCQIKLLTSANQVYQYWLSPVATDLAYTHIQNQGDGTYMGMIETTVPVPTTQTIYHSLVQVGGSGNAVFVECAVLGWEDKYIR